MGSVHPGRIQQSLPQIFGDGALRWGPVLPHPDRDTYMPLRCELINFKAQKELYSRHAGVVVQKIQETKGTCKGTLSLHMAESRQPCTW